MQKEIRTLENPLQIKIVKNFIFLNQTLFKMKIILILKAMLIIAIPMFSQQIVEWSPLNLNQPTNLNTRNIYVVDSNIIWGTLRSITPTSNQVFRTIDGGQNFNVFTLPFSGSDRFLSDIYALNQDTAYTVTTTTNGAQVEGVHRTKDGGQTWDLIFSSEDEEFTVVKVHFFNILDGFVYGFTEDFNAKFFYTDDGGDTWEKSESEFAISAIFTEGGNDGFATIGDTVWCSNIDSQVLRSVDKGITWISFPIITIPDRVINDIAFKNHNQGLAISSLSANGNDILNALYKTDDGGVTWSNFSSLPNTLEANVLSYIPGTEGAYIITSGDAPTNENFLFTIDNGNTWLEGAAPSSLLSAEFLSPTLGFGGTNTNDGGLLKYNDDIFSSLTSTKEILIDNSVLNVSPNPVSDNLQISIDNKWSGNLQVQIVNSLGQTVHSITLEKYETHFSPKINVAELPVGMYRLLVSNGKEMLVQAFVKN